jgi:hypothetical protein
MCREHKDESKAKSNSKSTSKQSIKSASDSVSSPSVRVPDILLGSGVARQAQAAGPAIEAQSLQLNTDIAAMQAAEDMHVTFDNASHASILHTIQYMGTITVDPTYITIQCICCI